MPSDQFLQEASEAGRAAVTALAPSAIGATVAVMTKRGLTWGERCIQIAVGICFSWYTRVALEALFNPDPFLAQGIAFTIGLIAYDALPKFRERAIALVADLPDAVRDFLRRKDRS